MVAPMRRLLGWVVVLAAALAAVTYLALEGGEVGVLHTREGTAWRETHVWYVEGEGNSLWLEAATPERPWLLDLRRDPTAEIERDGDTIRGRAIAIDDPAESERVRERMREKYGWRDRWVALLQDTSRSVAVRFDPSR